MPLEPDHQLSLDRLNDSLSVLAEKAKAVSLQNPVNLLALSSEFERWTSEAKIYCGPWASTLAAQARQWVRGLEAGRPPLQGLERLLQGILEANAHLQEAKSPGKDKARTESGKEMLFFDLAQDPTSREESQPLPADATFLRVKEEDRDGFKDFLQEVPDHFSAIESALIHQGPESRWDVMKAYRPFHTLKSLFGYLGFTAMAEAAHRAEALLEPYKNGKGVPTEDQKESLLRTLDVFRRQVKLIAEGYPKGRIKILDTDQASGPVSPASQGSPGPSPAPDRELQEDFIRVDVAKMDGLLETMEELAIAQNRISEIAQGGALDPRLTEAVQSMDKLTRALQDRILSVRMVPVEPLFKRLARLVRDLSRKTSKVVQLQLEGADTELDKRLADELWEPAVHLIRNAMDHGLEPASERLASGKSAYGTLKVKAGHAGGDFILQVTDDGRGLNTAKIAEKAGRLGLLPTSGTSSPQWLEELVFRPGFSTAGKVTDVSGRGVGLDVVKRRIQALKGSIHLESWEGIGCRFTIRIPLTLALMEGVLLRVGESLYLLPLSQVGRFWGMGEEPAMAIPEPLGAPEEEGSDPKKAAVRRPFLRQIDLAERFGESMDPTRQPVGIEVGQEESRAFLLADEILGKKHVVLKGLSGVLEGFPVSNGAALLSDGRVGLVLDIPALLRETVPAGGRVS